jgi:hypothetical protein
MLEPLEQFQLYVAMVLGIGGFVVSVVLAIKEFYFSFLLSQNLNSTPSKLMKI